ncbi:MAG: hypothetical protein KDE09_00690 [Anaerolineales bacterium]|nr:hypothetical protein [Anaerolineales bacterium]MCB0026510.1 hypothetical protein [Anaerolineales bacterium]
MMEQDAVFVSRELDIVELMITSLPDYLVFDGIFYPLTGASLPRLTLGSLLMRLYRLGAIADSLEPDAAQRLKTACNRFAALIPNNQVAIEQKAGAELDMRLQQWESANIEWRDKGAEEGFWQNNVEIRTIINALVSFLQKAPFHVHVAQVEEMLATDSLWQAVWHSGPFVWAEVWEPAYPKAHYWWLYGEPG